MNYAFVDNLNLTKAKQLLAYLTDMLYRARKFKYLTGMVPTWTVGKQKVEARIQQLTAKKTATKA